MSTELVRATPRTTAARRMAAQATNAQRRGAVAPATDWAFLTGGDYPEVSVWPATEAEAMALPPFGRGVELLASAVAGTSWRAMRWDAAAGVDVRLPDQPQVLTDPDPTTTPWHYRHAAVEDLVLYGNHFARYGFPPDFRTGRPGWLVPLPASDVWLMIDPELGSWSWAVGGELLSADEVLHVSAGNRSGEVLGRGVLGQYGAWLGGVTAAEAHAGAYFAGGALPPAVLQAPTVLTQDQADELKARWRAMTTTREPVVLPNGYVLTPVVSNAEQAQLVESRQWNAQAVAMLLGIPSYKLGLSGASMTYQNIESADIEWVRDSVDRYAQPLSQGFTKWLMPHGTTVAWDWAGRMRTDTKTQAEVVGSLVTSGLLTLDEGRAIIGRPPLPEGDGYTPVGPGQDEPPTAPEEDPEQAPEEVA